MLTVCAEEPVHSPAVSRRATTAIYYALAVEVALIVLFAVMYNPFDFNVYVWGGGSQSGRVPGSPNRGSTLLSKRVKAGQGFAGRGGEGCCDGGVPGVAEGVAGGGEFFLVGGWRGVELAV